ncbi:MAG: rod shape-determining protein [Bacteroidota bacterium]
MAILDFMTKTVAVDAGSQNLRIGDERQIIFNETAQLSLHRDTNAVSGIGFGAVQDATNKVIRPVNNVIADFHGFEHLLRGALKKSTQERKLLPYSYKVYFSIPINISEVEKRAYRDSGEHAGAKLVYMIHQPCCVALAMGILLEKKEFVLIDFSATKMEITVFSKGIPLVTGIVRMGTWRLKLAIKNYIFRTYGTVLKSDQLTHLFLNAHETHTIEVDGKPIEIEGLLKVLEPYFMVIEDQILEAIESVSTHASIAKIVANGIYVSGGGAKLPWLVDRLRSIGKINYTISKQPLLDGINGLIKVMKGPDKFKSYLMT